MTEQSKATTFDIGQIERASRAIFRRKSDGAQSKYRYVVSPTMSTWSQVYDRFPQLADSEFRNVEFYCEDSDGKFYCFYSEDCAFPPMAIIRAMSWEDAYESFKFEFKSWLEVSTVDLADYDENSEHLEFVDMTPIDTESVQGFECELESVHCE